MLPVSSPFALFQKFQEYPCRQHTDTKSCLNAPKLYVLGHRASYHWLSVADGTQGSDAFLPELSPEIKKD